MVQNGGKACQRRGLNKAVEIQRYSITGMVVQKMEWWYKLTEKHAGEEAAWDAFLDEANRKRNLRLGIGDEGLGIRDEGLRIMDWGSAGHCPRARSSIIWIGV